MRALVAVLVLLGLVLRKKKTPQGQARALNYFKVNGRCMVKPEPFPGEPELPAVQIPCDQWEREVAQQSKAFVENGDDAGEQGEQP